MRPKDVDKLHYHRELIDKLDRGIGSAVVVYAKEIDKAPTVEAVPVRHGKWVKNDNGTYSCSECKSWIPNEQYYYARYCLFCGAKMDEEEEK